MEGAFRSARPRAESQCLCPRAAQDATERAHHDCRAQGAQRITAELADAQAALRAQMKITLDAQRIALNAFRLQAGKGRAEVSGALRKDAHSGYQLNAAFSSFAPFALLQKPPQTHPA